MESPSKGKGRFGGNEKTPEGGGSTHVLKEQDRRCKKRDCKGGEDETKTARKQCQRGQGLGLTRMAYRTAGASSQKSFESAQSGGYKKCDVFQKKKKNRR